MNGRRASMINGAGCFNMRWPRSGQTAPPQLICATPCRRGRRIWDAEGPEGRLCWRRSNRTGNGFLEVRWSPAETTPRVMLQQRQLVAAFYNAFRAFVESPAYHPQGYESPQASGTPLKNLQSAVMERWLLDQAT